MGRKQASEKTVILSFRVPESAYRRFTAWLNVAKGSLPIRASDVARMWFLRRLDTAEAEAKKRGKL
jgi:hypothetical protein